MKDKVLNHKTRRTVSFSVGLYLSTLCHPQSPGFTHWRPGSPLLMETYSRSILTKWTSIFYQSHMTLPSKSPLALCKKMLGSWSFCVKFVKHNRICCYITVVSVKSFFLYLHKLHPSHVRPFKSEKLLELMQPALRKCINLYCNHCWSIAALTCYIKWCDFD